MAATRRLRPQPRGRPAWRSCCDWRAEGRLHPHVSQVLPFEAFPEGLDLLRDRKATGKVVIRVGSGPRRRSAVPDSSKLDRLIRCGALAR